jgi:CheY-like chemotaxis protein
MKKDHGGGARMPAEMNAGIVSGVVVVEDTPEFPSGPTGYGAASDDSGAENRFAGDGFAPAGYGFAPAGDGRSVIQSGSAGRDDRVSSVENGSGERGSVENGSGERGSGERGSGRRGPRRPCAVVVDGDDEVQSRVSRALGAACHTHRARPAAALALLEGMSVVDVALVDCDQPVAVQAPIFRELARWPGALCVLMSANSEKVEQLRALGLFAPLVLDKPVQPEALEAIRSAALELFGPA